MPKPPEPTSPNIEQPMPNHTPPAATLPPIDRLRQVVHLLRAPGGCPWDIEQTHQSLIPNLLEEAYETADAIRSGDHLHMREELGDLLLQAVMHSEIASESDHFDLDAVASGVTEKLIRRHPHVFADSDATGTDAVLKQWEEIKQAEKGPKSQAYLDNVTTGLPSLIRATKIQKKVAKVGFDWPDPSGALAKVHEELAEVEHAIATDDGTTPEEIGDLLFAVVNLARKHGLDAETLLNDTNNKFTARFHQIESTLRESGTSLKQASLDEMESAWQSAKT